MKKVIPMTPKGTIHHDELCPQESRITAVEEKITTIFHNQGKIESTLDKLDKTQDKLAISIAELNRTFQVLKVIGGILVTLFGGIAVFIITEIIKMIH